MKKTLIVTIRHGTTTFNKLKKIAGTLDVPLDSNGVFQAKNARNIIDEIKLDVIISSPYKRCVDTAVLSTNIPEKRIIIRKECGERNYGRMQGLLPEEIKTLVPKVLYVKSGKYYHSLNPPEGETFEMLRRRAQKLAEYILRYYRGKKIGIFSHQTYLQQFQGYLRGEDPYICLSYDILPLEMNFFIFDSHNLIKSYSKRPVNGSYDSW